MGVVAPHIMLRMASTSRRRAARLTAYDWSGRSPRTQTVGWAPHFMHRNLWHAAIALSDIKESHGSVRSDIRLDHERERRVLSCEAEAEAVPASAG
jgi:hypothetical protein